jgi:hypothetical protein
VIIAADADLLDVAVGQVGAAMRTMAVEQPVAAALVLVEYEVFPEQPDRLDRVVVELAGATDRLPVAAQTSTQRT